MRVCCADSNLGMLRTHNSAKVGSIPSRRISIIDLTVQSDMENIFYTYAYLRSVGSETAKEGTPYYIGKGKQNRAYNAHDSIPVPKDLTRILTLKSGLSEEEAWRHEIYMIAVFGRKDLDTGILLNKTNGGEGTSGVVWSEERKLMFGESRSGENNPNFGKKPSEGSCQKRSESMSGRQYWVNDLGECRFQVKCPGVGWRKGQTEDHRKKNSEASSGAKNSQYGTIWVTNGKSNMKIKKENPIPEGYRKGRVL